MNVDKKKLLEWLSNGKHIAGPVTLQWVIDHVEKGKFDADPEATVDYWKRLAADQQMLKEKAEQERNEVQRLLKNELQHAVTMAKQNVQLMEGIHTLNERLSKKISDLQEERDHLLAANDEFQEKLRFEGETV